jgi:hypothetical protein
MLELSDGAWRDQQLARVQDLLSAQYERQRMFTSAVFTTTNFTH